LKHIKSVGFGYSLLFISITFIIAISCEPAQKASNHLTSEELLGRYLFFETSLSANNTKSCASCHNTNVAFADGYRKSGTAFGENTLHNAPSLINAVDLKFLDWGNPVVNSLEKQVKRPLYNAHPIELGFQLDSSKRLREISNHKMYQKLISKAYPNQPFSSKLLEQSIVAYVKKLQSRNSAFDQNIMSESAKKGFELFKSERFNCISCHTLPDFTLATKSINTNNVFANIGLYNVQNQNKYPELDNGIAQFTKQPTDDGMFKIPSLRNVLLTAPYMHDGSVESIEEVINIYSRGGRNIAFGPNTGDGKNNKKKHKLITGFSISETEKQDLISFLGALTDSTIFTNPIFQNPNRIK
jgi:cytochrome c peroxidase